MSRYSHFIALILLSALILTGAPLNNVAFAAGTIYVDVDATGAETGASWTDAYTSLQDALAAAVSGDQIWVAEGIYYPDVGSGVTDDDRTETFTLVDGVGIYGGFVGTESSLGERDWETNVTVLSGDIDEDDTADPNGVVTDVANITGSNAYHVVTGSGTDSTAVLDGFVVTAGNAEGFDTDLYGGGMYNIDGSPSITHLIFSGNNADMFGGAVYNIGPSSPQFTHVDFVNNQTALFGGGIYNGNSTPTLYEVVFSGNQTGSSYTGGGMFNDASNVTLTNVTFSDNQSTAGGGAADTNGSDSSYSNVTIYGNQAEHGAGLFIQDSSPSLTNVVISGNLATEYGGGINTTFSSPTLINVTLSGNQAEFGGGLYLYESSLIVTSSILWNNDAINSGDQISNQTSTPVISHSDIQGSGGSSSWDTGLGTDGGGNLDVDPLFLTPVDPLTAPTTAGDLHMPVSSPVLEMGDDGACPATDLDGVTRPQGAHCDMGAYEFIANAPPGLLLTLHRSPASIPKGSPASGPNQWFGRVVLGDHTGDPGLAFHYVVWLHVPEDWTLPWATQYSFTGDFVNTTLTQDWSAQSWVQDTTNCAFGGTADAGFKWRAFRGPQEALPPLVDRLDNQVNLRGGLGVPGGETSDLYGGVRVVSGTYYDFDPDGTPDRYVCDHVAVTSISIP